jgi:hypothetical protein
MSLYSRGEPVSNNQFRENTAKRAVMAGVAKIPGKTLCVCCGKRRTTETGKVTAKGFVCHGCGGWREKRTKNENHGNTTTNRQQAA